MTYGVIALGDTTYKDTFCHGGIRFDKMLTELGAKRAGEMLMHDAGSGTLPEEDGGPVGRALGGTASGALHRRWHKSWQQQWKIRLRSEAKVLQSYLGGKWQAGSRAGTALVNPTTGETVAWASSKGWT